MKALLVTGHDGFIGRHVCQVASEHGTPVVGIGRASQSADPHAAQPARVVEEAITLHALERATDGIEPIAIIHCAGTGTVGRAADLPFTEFERSVGATATLLEFARTRLQAAPRVVLTSSAAVYGETSTSPATESLACAPISAYGFHKVMAEQLCHCYAQQFHVPITVVRLFSVYGPGLRKQLPWDAMSRLRRGDRHFHCTGNELRDWLHVRDAAQLLWRAATREQAPWEILNSSGQRATTRDMLRTLSKSAGMSEEPTFSGMSQPSNPMNLIGSSARAERTLGWRPTITLEEGLSEFATWCGKVMPAP
jgi:UDP-glucose 4-epimerase